MQPVPVSVSFNDGLATVHIDNPPVNALSVAVRQGLLDALNQTESNPQVLAVLLICTGKTFIAGADIREFGKPAQEPHLPDLIAQIEAASKPWVAAIHGTALGGGLEVALGCRYRIAATSAKVGLPEVMLGLIPGAGGTVRLPRLIGVETALDFILRAKPVDATKAKQLGIVDELSSSDLITDATDLATRIMHETAPQALIDRPVPQITDQENWQKKLQNLTVKHAGQNAPMAVITAIKNTLALPNTDALALERELFLSLKDGKQSASMRHLFMAERSATRISALKDVPANKLAVIGIIGGGTMGAGISAACLLAGLQVIMIERDDEALHAGQQRVNNTLDNSLQRKLINEHDHGAMLNAFSADTDYSSLAKADLVIEAVFETMEVKKSVFIALDKHTRADAILASNTSYLDINQIAQYVENPARVIGLHFFSPAHIMKLLELIVTDQADPTALATGFALAKRLQKICVPSGVCDGFIGNRIMSAYRRVCDEMLEDGAMPQDVDQAMISFGFPMGIFQMQDLAGLDIAWAMRKRQAATRNPDDRYVNIADRLCELGRFGRKSGKGWYVYDGKKATFDSEVEAIIVSESANKGIERQVFNADRIMKTILETMQNEGQKVLSEGIAQSAEAIDVVMTNGYGFPRWRGGPMYMLSESANG
ncbi:MAG: 3-hydroxyacyl-CoA dehydrogenase NAD-binding domain-containing protein [Granulosicoccus sp.]